MIHTCGRLSAVSKFKIHGTKFSEDTIDDVITRLEIAEYLESILFFNEWVKGILGRRFFGRTVGFSARNDGNKEPATSTTADIKVILLIIIKEGIIPSNWLIPGIIPAVDRKWRHLPDIVERVIIIPAGVRHGDGVAQDIGVAVIVLEVGGGLEVGIGREEAGAPVVVFPILKAPLSPRSPLR